MAKYDIFISYRRSDTNLQARLLKLQLKQLGLKVFLDLDEIPDGQFDKRIFKAIDSAPIFLLLLSKGIFDRCKDSDDWIRKEILYADEKAKHIIPVDFNNAFGDIPKSVPVEIEKVLGHHFSQLDTNTLWNESVEKLYKERIEPHINGKGSNLITIKGVKFEMVHVPGGDFLMGATDEQNNEAHKDEKPVHTVRLSDYYICNTPVTQALWEAVMGNNPSAFPGKNKPVERVSWTDCEKFILKLNEMSGRKFRLPTEAEWEFAARGGENDNTYKYSGSNNIADVAWNDKICYLVGVGGPNYGTRDVKGKSPNKLGLYDMSGNVSEWCSDWYADYTNKSQVNPKGPQEGAYKVIRGGAWNRPAWRCRVSYRGFNEDRKQEDIGLRLVLDEL